jgi:hypothetical protein
MEGGIFVCANRLRYEISDRKRHVELMKHIVDIEVADMG